MLGGGTGVYGHTVGAANYLLGEFVLEGLYLRTLHHHAGGDNRVHGSALLSTEDRLRRGNECEFHLLFYLFQSGVGV